LENPTPLVEILTNDPQYEAADGEQHCNPYNDLGIAPTQL